MDRRTLLRSVGVAGATFAAGCLGSLPGTGDGRTRLGPPEQSRGDPTHPIHGDELTEFTLPAPLHDEEITTTQFVGERAVLMTFFYTHCPDGMCPALVQRLRQTQLDAESEGYADDIAFLATTFDPERDTADRLREYADEQGVDRDAGNWYFLRPESYAAGKELLADEFGFVIEKQYEDDESGDGNHDHVEGGGEYTFPHVPLVLLANEDGYVERAYPSLSLAPMEQLLADVHVVVGV